MDGHPESGGPSAASSRQTSPGAAGAASSSAITIGEGLLVIDKSKIPRPYKCPFPNCDKAFYRLEQCVSGVETPTELR